MTGIRFASSAAAAFGVAVLLGGCGGGQGAGPARTTIQVKGSDTMVNVAQAWAEEYKQAAPQVDVDSRRWRHAFKGIVQPEIPHHGIVPDRRERGSRRRMGRGFTSSGRWSCAASSPPRPTATPRR